GCERPSLSKPKRRSRSIAHCRSWNKMLEILRHAHPTDFPYLSQKRNLGCCLRHANSHESRARTSIVSRRALVSSQRGSMLAAGLGDLQSFLRRHTEKLEARPHVRRMAHDGNCAQAVLRQLQIDFHRFSKAQISLYQRSQTTFADVQRDPTCRADSARHQVT